MASRPARVLFVSGGVGLGHVTRDLAMRFAGTTPPALGEAVLAHIGEDGRCGSVPLDGAARAAALLAGLLPASSASCRSNAAPLRTGGASSRVVTLVDPG